MVGNLWLLFSHQLERGWRGGAAREWVLLAGRRGSLGPATEGATGCREDHSRPQAQRAGDTFWRHRGRPRSGAWLPRKVTGL